MRKSRRFEAAWFSFSRVLLNEKAEEYDLLMLHLGTIFGDTLCIYYEQFNSGRLCLRFKRRIAWVNLVSLAGQ